MEQLPGFYPRHVIEAVLPLEYPDPWEAGLLLAYCPGLPEGEHYHAHKLRIKIVGPETVDVWCPAGCRPALLKAVIEDMFRSTQEGGA